MMPFATTPSSSKHQFLVRWVAFSLVSLRVYELVKTLREFLISSNLYLTFSLR